MFDVKKGNDVQTLDLDFKWDGGPALWYLEKFHSRAI